MSKRKCQTQQTSYVPEPMYRMRKILHYIMALQFLGTLSLYQILPLLHFLTNYFKKNLLQQWQIQQDSWWRVRKSVIMKKKTRKKPRENRFSLLIPNKEKF